MGNFRAHRAWNIAYRLEQMGKEGNLREASLVLNELEEELTRVKGFLEKALQSPSS